LTLHRVQASEDSFGEFFWRLSLAVCLIALAVVCIRVVVQAGRHKHSGYFVYVDAGRAWREGRHLYTSLDDLPPAERQQLHAKIANAGEWQVRENTIWGGYRYSPTAAILFVPLSFVPGPVGEVVWRVFLAVVAYGALFWCSQLAIPRPMARRHWSIFFLLVLWSYTGCLNNGQSSCLIVGCLLGSVAACCTDRWTLAAVLIAIPTALKLYPVSLGLLFTLLYPRKFGPRFAIALVVAFALPFLLRPYAMVEEHRRWFWHLLNDAKMAVPLTSWDQDVRLLVRRFLGITLSMKTFMALQLLVAGTIAAICIAGRLAGWPRRSLLARTFGMATCWMTAFGMATEPSTYILVAPTLAWSIWEVWLRPSRRATYHGGHSPGGAASRIVLAGCLVLLIMAYVFLWFPWGRIPNSYGPEPLAGTLLLGYLIVRSVRELRGVRKITVGEMVCQEVDVGRVTSSPTCSFDDA